MPNRDEWFLAAIRDDVTALERLATEGTIAEQRDKVQSLFWATGAWLEAQELTCSSSLSVLGAHPVTRICNKPVGHPEELHSDGFAVWRNDTPGAEFDVNKILM